MIIPAPVKAYFMIMLALLIIIGTIELYLMVTKKPDCPKGMTATYSKNGNITIVTCNNPASRVQIKAQ